MTPTHEGRAMSEDLKELRTTISQRIVELGFWVRNYEAGNCAESIPTHALAASYRKEIEFAKELFDTIDTLQAENARLLREIEARKKHAKDLEAESIAVHAELSRLTAEREGKVLCDAEPVNLAAIKQLARRCLWIAFVWNDHNFEAAHKEARAEAIKHGITDFDSANEWIETALRGPLYAPTEE